MIEGVKIKTLKVIPDERGRLMEILRNDDDFFEIFGQVYMTSTYPDVVKAWHFHHSQADNIVCVQGMIKLVLYDPREDSPTQKEISEYFIGIQNPLLVQIPPGVYHGWMGVSPEEAIIINIPTESYDYTNPDEHRIDPHDNNIPYEWKRKNG